MTTVSINLQKLSGINSGLATANGVFWITPYAAEKIPSGGMLTMAQLTIPVVSGQASVVLPPTAAGHAIVFNPFGIPGLSKRIVAIPDSTTPVAYEDLVDLDPSTLDPAAPLTPAWLVALQGWKLVQLADTGLADAVPGQAIVLGEDGKTWVPGSAGGGSGTVTNVSGGSANGFEVDVANETTTPQITMKVTFSGIAKGNGGTLSAATAADIINTLAYTPAPASAIPANTDALPQGETNLYFTSALARAAVSLTAGSSGATYTPGTGVFDLSGVQAALGFTPENVANKGATNGYAPLVNGLVPSANLPAYVDEVQEYATLADFPETGSANIIYVAQDTELIYRWSGSTYIEINPSPGNTDAIPEGVVNLYFTTARAQAAQVQPDWNATSGKGQILNQPTIPAAPVNADWNASGGLAQILNKPTIPAAQVQTDWDATSGLGVLLNKPGIATPAIIGLSKPDNSTIVIAGDGTLSIPAPINIADLASLATLQISQQAYIDVSAATSIPTWLSTDQGEYVISIAGSYNGSISGSGWSGPILLPNNSSITNSFIANGIWTRQSVSSPASPNNYSFWGYLSGFPLSYFNTPFMSHAHVNTRATSKAVDVSSLELVGGYLFLNKFNGAWLNTASSLSGGLDSTTGWTELGTIVSSTPLTGRITITRVA